MTKVTSSNYFLLDPKIREITENIGNKISVDGNYALDPLTVISIANSVIGVIRILYRCYKGSPDALLEKMRNPGFIARILIKRQIKKYVDPHLVDLVFDAICSKAYGMQPGDVASVLHMYERKTMFRRD